MSIAIQLGRQIRSIRKKLGMSQEELAFKAGLSPAHLGQIERALKKPTVETVDKIAAALGVSFAELFSFGTTPTDQSDAVTNKINAYLSSMSESEKKDILRIIRIFKHFDNSQTTKND